MADDPEFCSKHVLNYLMYIALIAVCVAGIVYLLMHARPEIAPQVKHDANSRLTQPLLQSNDLIGITT